MCKFRQYRLYMQTSCFPGTCLCSNYDFLFIPIAFTWYADLIYLNLITVWTHEQDKALTLFFLWGKNVGVFHTDFCGAWYRRVSTVMTEIRECGGEGDLGSVGLNVRYTTAHSGTSIVREMKKPYNHSYRREEKGLSGNQSSNSNQGVRKWVCTMPLSWITKCSARQLLQEPWKHHVFVISCN